MNSTASPRGALPWAKKLATIDAQRHQHKLGPWRFVFKGCAKSHCERCGLRHAIRVQPNKAGLVYLTMPKSRRCKPSPQPSF